MEKEPLIGLPRAPLRIRPWTRRRRAHSVTRYATLACLAILVYYITFKGTPVRKPPNGLSIQKLHEQLATCKLLREVPSGPSGPREVNRRWVNGTRPTLIRNATIWTGEPSPGTSADDAKKGIGYAWTPSDVLVDRGLIIRVSRRIPTAELPANCEVHDARGRPLTAGIVDMHSHAGLDEYGDVGDDSNELSNNITPFVKSIDGFDPLSPAIQYIKSGGVTTSLILPGSGNNMGGEAFVMKMAAGRTSGRTEISQEDMLADPERTWRYMKMACGENPKRVYGKVGRGPFSRLGEGWEFRHAFEQARDYVDSQDDWCRTAEIIGIESMESYMPTDLRLESLGAVLRGQIRVNTHCYTTKDLEAYVRLTNDFKFRVYAFHHAHQTYLIPEVLKRAYGGTPASALFADSMYYKAEAYIASERAGKILYDEGITPVYVSDHPVLNSQHVVFEAAKAYSNGLPYHAALAGVTSAPAKLLGLGERIGKIKEGFDADLVLWDADPLSVAANPVQVWIDGIKQFEKPVELKKPLSKPMEHDASLQEPKTARTVGDVVFANIKRDFLSASDVEVGSLHAVVRNGSISCIGMCAAEVAMAKSQNHPVIDLENGFLTPPMTAFGSSLGLVEITAARTTNDGGYTHDSFARAVDGLSLDGKNLRSAFEHGVTRAISAPSRDSIDARGVSSGFLTGAHDALEQGAIWCEEVAAHYPFTVGGQEPTSSAVGELRRKLLKALDPVAADKKESKADRYAEEHFLREVVRGAMPLVLSAHKADTIAALIRLKSEIDAAAAAANPTGLRLVVLGGAESHLVARDLARAGVGVALAPPRSHFTSWGQRRAPPGAPLTNGTVLDALLAAGVRVAVGAGEIWETRDLRFMAGVAWRNSGGRLDERGAWGLVGRNVYEMLGIEGSHDAGEWLVWEGNPLEIGGRLRGLGSNGKATIWI